MQLKVVKDYQSKGIMTFLVGDVIEQCADAGVKMGLELRVVPLGHDVTAVIHVVTVAIRAALIFGNVQPGDLAGLLAYTKAASSRLRQHFRRDRQCRRLRGRGRDCPGLPGRGRH